MSDVFKGFKPERRLYKLKRNSTGAGFGIQVSHKPRKPLLWFDEEKGKQREIRYASNQDSPFVDEQKGTAFVEHVWFRDGILSVPREQVALQKFLSVHPGNKDNGGRIFYEVRKDDEAKKEIEEYETAASAVVIAQEMDIQDMSAILFNEIGSRIDGYTSIQIKKDILALAFSSPDKFITLSEDEEIKVKFLSHEAFKYGVVKDRGGYVSYGNVKTKLVGIPVGLDAEQALTNFLFSSDDGQEALEIIKEKIKEKLS